MRPWVKWCLKHKQYWLLYVALFICIPVFFVFFLVYGLVKGTEEWWGNFKDIRCVIATDKTKSEISL